MNLYELDALRDPQDRWPSNERPLARIDAGVTLAQPTRDCLDLIGSDCADRAALCQGTALESSAGRRLNKNLRRAHPATLLVLAPVQMMINTSYPTNCASTIRQTTE
jgi:hypothetical protein